MSREHAFDDSDSFLRKQMTVELRSLLVKARSINENFLKDFDYSFTSIFLAFLVADDPISRWFQEYVKQADIRISEIIKSKELPQTFLDRIRELGESISTPERSPSITYSTQAIFGAASRLMMETGGQREQPLDTRHVMGAYIYEPSGHEQQLKSWGLNAEKWSSAFLSQIAFLYPSELIHWIETHAHKFGSQPSLNLRRVIIPPNFTNLALQVNYFTPRFKKVSRGEDIQWVNQDNKTHHLQFYDLSDDRMELLFNSGPIEPGNSFERKFNTDLIRIDYICSLHENEVGTVIVYQTPENEMTNTQQIRFLSKLFNIEPPPIFSHVRPR